MHKLSKIACAVLDETCLMSKIQYKFYIKRCSSDSTTPPRHYKASSLHNLETTLLHQ